MTDDGTAHSRRSFLQSTGTTATTALTIATTGVSTSLAGCSALPGGDGGPNAPDYDSEAVTSLVREPFPNPPVVFPVEIPSTRFAAHEDRARAFFDAVPEQPELPNEATANRIARERRDLSEHLGEMHDEHTPRDRLGRWRYYRSQAAEVWGSYVAATAQYSPRDFQTRFDELRAAYTEFDGDWNYRGSNPATALIVHHAIEELISRGRDEVLSTGPFPTDPQAAVFEAGRMVSAHERAAANLEDARAIRTRYLEGQSGSPSHRLAFADAIERLRQPARFERARGQYEHALEEGPSALDVEVGNGPGGKAFEHARRTAIHIDEEVREATARNDPATATLQAARNRLATRTFGAVVDDIHADELTWPADVSAFRALRATTIETLENAWTTSPEPLAVELTSHPYGLLSSLAYYYSQHELDDNDFAGYVGTLHYVTRYAEQIPDVTTAVVDTVTTE